MENYLPTQEIEAASLKEEEGPGSVLGEATDYFSGGALPEGVSDDDYLSDFDELLEKVVAQRARHT